MTILEQIKALCKTMGIPVKYADQILKTFNVEKEDQVQVAVENFNTNIFPIIKEQEAAAQAAVVEYEKKYKIKDGKPVEEKKPQEQNPPIDLSGLSPEMQAFFQVQQTQMQNLTDLVTNLTSGQVKAQRMEIVRAKMKGKIDDDFLEDYVGRVNLDTEDLDGEIGKQVETYTKMSQKFINKAVAEGRYEPASGSVSDSDFNEFLKTKGENKPEFEGIKL